jgi:hypothetical protein
MSEKPGKGEKRQRLLTDRKHSFEGSWDGLDLCENGVVLWVGEDTDPRLPLPASFSMPVDLDFIIAKFATVGREFDASRMPEHFQPYPWG